MKILKRKFLNVKTKTCHASTVCFYQDEPIFAWFGGTMEGDPDSSIYVQTGKKVHLLVNKHKVPMWNPVLFPFRDKLFLFVKAGIFCDRWQSFIMDISNIFEPHFDLGNVAMEILPAGLNGPVKTKPIFQNGIIYCGSSVETIYDWSSYIESYIYDENNGSFVYVSRSSPLTVPKTLYKDPYGSTRVSKGIIQPSLWVDSKGHLNAFMRSSGGLGRIYYSCSKDDIHEKWSTPAPTKFENPNSSIDTVFFKGRLFLVYNPDVEYRAPLVVSEIEGELLEVVNSVTIKESIAEEELKKTSLTTELSYPYMVEHDGKLHCTYTHGRTKIEYVEIEI
jgi:predicted neuraminidase